MTVEKLNQCRNGQPHWCGGVYYPIDGCADRPHVEEPGMRKEQDHTSQYPHAYYKGRCVHCGKALRDADGSESPSGSVPETVADLPAPSTPTCTGCRQPLDTSTNLLIRDADGVERPWHQGCWLGVPETIEWPPAVMVKAMDALLKDQEFMRSVYGVANRRGEGYEAAARDIGARILAGRIPWMK